MHLSSDKLDRLFETFFEITSLLHAGRDDTDVFAHVLDCAVEILEADRCSLLLAHQGRVLVFWKSRAGGAGMQRDELVGTEAALAWIERERQPFLGAPGEWHFPAADEIVTRGAASLVVAPLVAKESHVGLLVALRDDRPRGFDIAHLKVLTALANQTAIAIENAGLYERLKHEAVTDGLTGVYNYKTLMQSLRTELGRAQRYGHPMTFVMIDVDHLKRYNDKFGHVAGSEVLAQLAHLLAAACRNTDIVGKYGGDEFALILPQTGLSGACAVAERMRSTIAAHGFQNVAPGDITCSFGIACYPEDGTDVHALVAAADQMLFQAKREGKNTLRATTQPSPDPGSAAALPVEPLRS